MKGPGKIMGGRQVWAAVALGLVAGWGCEPGSGDPDEWEPLVSFDTIDAAVVSDGDTIPLTAELADTPDRRSWGLMERPTLPEDHGMIFVYPEEQDPAGGFWMFRTKVPLDIAFLAADGEIVSIMAMDPCPTPTPDLCRRYSPGIAFRGALEVRQGFFREHGVQPGDRVVPAPADLPAEY